TERFRDERREGETGAKMHGRDWHDHEEAKDFELELMAGADAIPEVEAEPEIAGMGRRRMKASGTQGRERRKRTTPPSKGPKKKPGAPKPMTQQGHRAKGRV